MVVNCSYASFLCVSFSITGTRSKTTFFHFHQAVLRKIRVNYSYVIAKAIVHRTCNKRCKCIFSDNAFLRRKRRRILFCVFLSFSIVLIRYLFTCLLSYIRSGLYTAVLLQVAILLRTASHEDIRYYMAMH